MKKCFLSNTVYYITHLRNMDCVGSMIWIIWTNLRSMVTQATQETKVPNRHNKASGRLKECYSRCSSNLSCLTRHIWYCRHDPPITTKVTILLNMIWRASWLKQRKIFLCGHQNVGISGPPLKLFFSTSLDWGKIRNWKKWTKTEISEDAEQEWWKSRQMSKM